jgi:hypothetical protein
MTATHSPEDKSVSFQSPDDNDEPTDRAAHGSYMDNNGRFRQLNSALPDGDAFAGFEDVLDLQVDRFANIGERFFITVARAVATLLLDRKRAKHRGHLRTCQAQQPL